MYCVINDIILKRKILPESQKNNIFSQCFTVKVQKVLPHIDLHLR